MSPAAGGAGQGKPPREDHRGPELRTPKTAELIADRIATHIIERNLQPGDVLQTEREMCEQFGASRGSLREALRILETQGVIRMRPGPGGGPVVRRTQPADLAGSLTLMLQLLDVPFRQAATARLAIERWIVAQVAETGGAGAMPQLEASIARMREFVDDDELFIAEYFVFHDTLSELSENVVLRVFAESLRTIASGVRGTITYESWNRQLVVDTLARVCEAVERRDPVAAEESMVEHLQDFSLFLERRYPELMSQPIRWIVSSIGR